MSAVEKVVKDLKELEDLIIQCSRCGTCQSVCPLYKKDKAESSVARGKMYLIDALLEGKFEKVDEIFKYIDYCILCGRCKRDCPSGVETDELFLKAKGILRQVKKLPAWQKLVLKVAMGQPKLLAAMAPLFHIGIRIGTHKVDDGVFKARELFKPFLGEMGDKHLVDMAPEALTKKYGGFNEARNEKMRVVYYPGCATTLIYTHWGEAIIETLLHYGVSVYVPKVNKCCGIPSATMGEMGIYKTQVEANYDWFDSIEDADYVVTSCPTCEYGLADMGPKTADRTTEKKFVDILVFLTEILKADLPKEIPLGGSSTLHVPCHWDHSKDGMLKSFVGDHFDTDYQDLRNQSCCGFGGTFSMKNYPHSKEIGLQKAEEIKERGFTNLFTPCPGCAMQLTDVNASAGTGVKATHPVVEIYERHIKKGR